VFTEIFVSLKVQKLNVTNTNTQIRIQTQLILLHISSQRLSQMQVYVEHVADVCVCALYGMRKYSWGFS